MIYFIKVQGVLSAFHFSSNKFINYFSLNHAHGIKRNVCHPVLFKSCFFCAVFTNLTFFRGYKLSSIFVKFSLNFMYFFIDFYVFFHNRIEDSSTILYKQIFIPKLIKQIMPAFSRLNFRTSCGCLEKQVIFFYRRILWLIQNHR